MSDGPVDADLRVSFELHRSRVLRLKHKCLDKLFEIHGISPNTTDPEEVDCIRCEEWPFNGVGHLPHPIKCSADLYALIDDGTKPPIPEEERLKLFAEIEAILKERAALTSGPLTLPDDFKQLCALTNSLKGPGLPSTNSCIPDAFDGLHNPLMGLKCHPDGHDESATASGLVSLDYTRVSCCLWEASKRRLEAVVGYVGARNGKEVGAGDGPFAPVTKSRRRFTRTLGICWADTARYT